MRSDWRELPFEEAIDFQEGPGILAKDFRPSGVPLVRLAGLGAGASVLDGCDFLDPAVVERRWSHFRLKKGDILLSTSASLGRIAIADDSAEGAIPYTGIIRMRPRAKGLDAPFIKYLLESPHFQRQVEAAGVGSVIRHFGPMHLRQMTVLLPPLADQRAIAAVLGSLDDKIDLNRRMNSTLEATARAIFKAWFVDFEALPVEAGRREPVAMVAERAARYGTPLRSVPSELGPIPEGWRVGEIGEEVRVVGGSTPRTEEPRFWQPGVHAWATPKDLSALDTVALVSTERRISDEGLAQISSGLLPRGTVLLSSRAPIGYLAIADVPVAINQGFIGMVCERDLDPWYAHQWTAHNLESIKARAGGTTFPEISKQNFRPLRVLVPPQSVLSRWREVARPLYEQIVASEKESRTLTSLRDTLLPKLLSGEVRVKDVA